MTRLILVAALLAGAAASAPSPLSLPGGEGGIGLDDLRFAPDLHRILVPAGRTGRLDLVDPSSRSVEVVEGFSRSAPSKGGHGEGPTSADAGQGFVFAIDRTTRTLVAVDPRSRRIVASTRLDGGPDYVRWVDPTHEVWVTEPDRESIETFRFQGGATPAFVGTGKISVPAGPEALEVDPAQARAYTNTFKDATVAIDVRNHSVIARWPNGCRGARGLALDAGRGWVFVGCDEGKAVALDTSHGGRTVGTAKTGNGVDSITFSPQLSHLYVPAADAATLSIIAVGERGQLEALGSLPTAPEAHCAAVDENSNVYVCDPSNGRLLVARDPYPPSH